MFTGRGAVGVKELERAFSEVSSSSSACIGVRSRLVAISAMIDFFMNLSFPLFRCFQS
jgi:hypothetical protein